MIFVHSVCVGFNYISVLPPCIRSNVVRVIHMSLMIHITKNNVIIIVATHETLLFFISNVNLYNINLLIIIIEIKFEIKCEIK